MSAQAPVVRTRRRLLGAAALLPLAHVVRVRAADPGLPDLPALTTFLAGRTPRFERVRLELPRLADNGLVVPTRLAVDGPFAPGAHVTELRLFSEINPVPEMAVFEYRVPVQRVELDTRIRLAGTQRIVAVARLADDALLAAVAEVVVTLAGCMDGT